MNIVDVVYVDRKDGYPETQYPTRNGGEFPVNVVQVIKTALVRATVQDTEYDYAVYTVETDGDTSVDGVLRVYDDADTAALLDEMKALKKQQVTDNRWAFETGGVTVNGVKIATDREGQLRITEVVTHAERSGITEVDFKAESGWVTVTIAEIYAIATVVAQHVQDCFSKERLCHENIDALDTPSAVAQFVFDYTGV